MKTYFDGIRFGMILQLAIGPCCLMVFNTAKTAGFLTAMSFVAAVVLVDALYITLAGAGICRFLENERSRMVFRCTGAAVLILFGMNMVLDVFGKGFIPAFSIQTDSAVVFIQGLIMTLSNPLTIVFWGGILTTNLAGKNMCNNAIVVFSAGLISATFLFMTAVALIGTTLSIFISDTAVNVLNVAVGVVIVAFGLKTARALPKNERN